MKFYSEVLDKLFDTAQEALKAEEIHQKKVDEEKAKKAKLDEERKTRAKEVEDAYKAAVDAEKKYADLKQKFIKDYGAFHMTYRDNGKDGWSTFFEEFLNLF